MRTYGAKNPDRQIKISPIPTKSQFAKFNARQTFPLYGTQQGQPSCENEDSINYCLISKICYQFTIKFNLAGNF